MNHEEAAQKTNAIQALRACEGWAETLLPEIEKRITDLEFAALRTTISNAPNVISRKAARERRQALKDVLDWLDTVEENARKSLADPSPH